jgi:hypothetical protein
VLHILWPQRLTPTLLGNPTVKKRLRQVDADKP